MHSIVEMNDRDTEYHFRPRFAAGRVFTTSMLDSLTCQSYLNPAVRPFLLLFIQLTLSFSLQVLAIVKIMLNNTPNSPRVFHVRITKEFIGDTCELLFAFLLARGMLPLGIYRTVGSLGSRLPYVLTNPRLLSIESVLG